MDDGAPLTALGASATAHHELYRTYVEAGFTPGQAMQILLLILQFGLMNSNNT